MRILLAYPFILFGFMSLILYCLISGDRREWKFQLRKND